MINISVRCLFNFIIELFTYIVHFHFPVMRIKPQTGKMRRMMKKTKTMMTIRLDGQNHDRQKKVLWKKIFQNYFYFILSILIIFFKFLLSSLIIGLNYYLGFTYSCWSQIPGLLEKGRMSMLKFSINKIIFSKTKSKLFKQITKMQHRFLLTKNLPQGKKNEFN